MSDAPGNLVGPWRLDAIIGTGGNAVVWRAIHESSGVVAAIKIIKSQKVEREPYQRFVTEVNFLRRLDSTEGILPLLDSNLPDIPKGADRAWLAMPIATPMAEAIAGESLEAIVEAVMTIAGTLARLKKSYGIGHRDVKPSNLYRLDDRWVIGDFGLIATPDRTGLTEHGKPMGPAHFAPWELALDPVTSDPFAVDVYSLGKTLWVLATGVNYAPDGFQPANANGVLVGDFFPHEHSTELDKIIEQTTQLRPEQRPSMEQVVSELKAWLTLPPDPARIDTEKFKKLLNEKIGPALTERQVRDTYVEKFKESTRRLDALMKPINEQLISLYEHSRIGVWRDNFAQQFLAPSVPLGTPVPLESHQRCSIVDPLERVDAVTLRLGWGLQLFPDGSTTLRMLVIVKRERLLGTYYTWFLEPLSAAVGSITEEKNFKDAIQQVTDHLRSGIASFIENQPQLES